MITVNRGPIAQRLKHLSHKEQVAGSNPAGSTKKPIKVIIFSGGKSHVKKFCFRARCVEHGIR